MTATNVQTMSTARIPTSRILLAGLAAGVLAAIANTIVRIIAVSVQTVDPVFLPLTWGPPAVFSIIGAIGATLVFWIISRTARRPVTTFTRVAIVTLVVSLVPNLFMLQAGSPMNMPGTTVGTVAALIVMHIVAAAVIITVLNRAGAQYERALATL